MGWGRWGGGQRGGGDGEEGNGVGEMGRGVMKRGRWRGGQREGGDGDEGNGKGEMGRGQRRGRRGSWQRGGAEEGARGGRISHMKCLGGHMECLGGTRLQIFLTLFTRATPGTPASILIKQVIVYRSVCLFICSAMGGQTARPKWLKFGG